MMPHAVYLDYNASAPLRPEAKAAMMAAMEMCGNPASVHQFGRRARQVVETAREAVARMVGARDSEIIFTSGATEANALALATPGRRVVVSAVEHESVRAIAGARVISVDHDGVIDLRALAEELAGDRGPTTVAVMLANHETGAIQPVGDVIRLAHDAGALVHIDAVQAVGRVGIDFAALEADTMAVSAHKLGGPQGIGALVVRDGLDVTPIMAGGGQERGRHRP
jgi:cysteine desulfurase